MPNSKPFGHSLKLLILSSCAGLMAACSTTAPVPTQQRVPVAERPPLPAPPAPEATTPPAEQVEVPKEVDIKAPKEVEPTETVEAAPPPPAPGQTTNSGVYYNNRDGLTPPHMAGRDTKRLALLLPFSTSSSRLAQEAQSMYRAAEMAVFDRNETDVLLFALCLLYTSPSPRDRG